MQGGDGPSLFRERLSAKGHGETIVLRLEQGLAVRLGSLAGRRDLRWGCLRSGNKKRKLPECKRDGLWVSAKAKPDLRRGIFCITWENGASRTCPRRRISVPLAPRAVPLSEARATVHATPRD